MLDRTWLQVSSGFCLCVCGDGEEQTGRFSLVYLTGTFDLFLNLKINQRGSFSAEILLSLGSNLLVFLRLREAGIK